MTLKSVFAGFGGQGVLMMGYLLALSAMRQGKNVTYLPSYGAEVRGGTANCTVVVSDEEIASPVASSPDIAVVMNNPSLLKYANLVRPSGIMLINSTLVTSELNRGDLTAVKVPASELAHKLGEDRSANVIMMGAFAQATGSLSLEAFKEALSQTNLGKKPKVLELNLKALEIGAQAAYKAKPITRRRVKDLMEEVDDLVVGIRMENNSPEVQLLLLHKLAIRLIRQFHQDVCEQLLRSKGLWFDNKGIILNDDPDADGSVESDDEAGDDDMETEDEGNEHGDERDQEDIYEDDLVGGRGNTILDLDLDEDDSDDESWEERTDNSFSMSDQGWQRAERAEPRANFSKRAEPKVGSARLLVKISDEPSHERAGSMARLGSARLV